MPSRYGACPTCHRAYRSPQAPCSAWTARGVRCTHGAEWSYFHSAMLCTVHERMDDPPLTREAAYSRRARLWRTGQRALRKVAAHVPA